MTTNRTGAYRTCVTIAAILATLSLQACENGTQPETNTSEQAVTAPEHGQLDRVASPQAAPTGLLPADLPKADSRAMKTQRLGSEELSRVLTLGYDVFDDRARATVLPTGDVSIARDGLLQIEPTPGVDSDGTPIESWNYGLKLARVDRGAGQVLGDAAGFDVDGSAIRLAYHGGVEVRYEHLALGLEQFVDIESRPAGSGDLRVTFATSTGFHHQPSRDGDTMDVLRGQEHVLSWHGLKAWDADGTILDARMERVADGFALVVNDTDANYPVTIDPLVTTPSWTQTGVETNGFYGFVVASAGDVNNDGFGDVIIGEPGYGTLMPLLPNRGRALVFQGSATGLLNTASWTYRGVAANAFYGNSVTSGNFNGDSFDDVLVGAPNAADSMNNVYGVARMFLGSSGGVSNTPTWEQWGLVAGAQFGFNIEPGDFNCDGDPDVAVSAYFETVGMLSGAGVVRIFHGNSSATPFISTTANATLNGVSANQAFGEALASGNVDGDMAGCDDLVVGAPFSGIGGNEGAAYLYIGAVTGLNTTSAWTTSGGAGGTRYADRIAIGDFDNDGNGDIAVGAPDWNGAAGANSGRVQVYNGVAAGVPSTTASWTVEGGTSGEALGEGVAAGDFNADGIDDLVAGAPNRTVTVASDGGADLYLGQNTLGLQSTRSWTTGGPSSGGNFGYDLAHAGDVNNDGFQDLIIGASVDAMTGSVFVYHGTPTCFIANVLYNPGDPNPGNTCEECNPALSTTAWSSKANSSPCDDANACTNGDVCTAGVCGGTALDCSDGLTCTSDVCTAGMCSNPTDAGACLIGGACFLDGAIESSNTCHICDATADQTDWTDRAMGVSCDDGQYCTLNEVCDGAGTCGGGTMRDCTAQAGQCALTATCDEFGDRCLADMPQPDGTMCDDSDVCTPTSTCQAGLCIGTPTDCSMLDDVCVRGVCDTMTGMCFPEDRSDGVNCDDMDACTLATTCLTGGCVGGSPLDCDDTNPCTIDGCDVTNGCTAMIDMAMVGMNCAIPTCSMDGTSLIGSSVCSGMGTCDAPMQQDCGAYLCATTAMGGACTNSCMLDTDCDQAAGAVCDTNLNQCIIPCTTTADCVDGTSVCVNTRCETLFADTTGSTIGTVNGGDTISLVSSSSLPQGAGYACSWTQTAGAEMIIIESPTDCETQVDAPFVGQPGEYCFELEITLDRVTSSATTCVTVEAGEQTCDTDDDCPGDQACLGGPGGSCVDCVTDEHCPMGQVCDTGENECVVPMAMCTDNSGCPDDQVCRTDGTCGSCDAVNACDMGEACVAGACVAVCINDTDCAAGETCDGGVCVTGTMDPGTDMVAEGDLKGSGCECSTVQQRSDRSPLLPLGLLAFGAVVFGIRRRRR